MPTLRALLLTTTLVVSGAGTATAAHADSSTAGNAASARNAASVRNKAIARPMVSDRGWSRAHFACLERLWARESGWNHRAGNGSGAYGIPQALPGHKMASAGRDWRTNPKTQIKWGLSYIKQRYGSPCSAWAHFQSRGWY
ncbi:transglycosylase SLT domain-containing protein [Nonomuraea mangrovi]|uniref:Transglycosylase SLT domain-containing protein n=1 Tax=Nonomuraea mangrovi TaxID=2316207 RepID=A0ABW4SXT5_9ACTN